MAAREARQGVRCAGLLDWVAGSWAAGWLLLTAATEAASDLLLPWPAPAVARAVLSCKLLSFCLC